MDPEAKASMVRRQPYSLASWRALERSRGPLDGPATSRARSRDKSSTIPAQAVKAFLDKLDSGASAACRANGCRSIGLNSEAEALMVWRQQRI